MKNRAVHIRHNTTSGRNKRSQETYEAQRSNCSELSRLARSITCLDEDSGVFISLNIDLPLASAYHLAFSFAAGDLLSRPEWKSIVDLLHRPPTVPAFDPLRFCICDLGCLFLHPFIFHHHDACQPAWPGLQELLKRNIQASDTPPSRKVRMPR